MKNGGTSGTFLFRFIVLQNQDIGVTFIPACFDWIIRQQWHAGVSASKEAPKCGIIPKTPITIVIRYEMLSPIGEEAEVDRYFFRNLH
jgi:hypothetical protein